MNISKNGIDLIKHFESFQSDAYICPGGVITIGYGTTRYDGGQPVKMGETITEERATELLMEDLGRFEFYINKNVRVILRQCQFDSLVSICYNIGVGAFLKSTLYKKLNWKADDPRIPKYFMMWRFANKVELPGLVRRRRSESHLYTTGELKFYFDEQS